jgi:endogenous inhibitor of DNA gyrase (YacG/DUF329 family)
VDSKGRKPLRCPICQKLTYWEGNPYRPFCSRECKLADLYNWFYEEYRINLKEEKKEKFYSEGEENEGL